MKHDFLVNNFGKDTLLPVTMVRTELLTCVLFTNFKLIIT